MGCGVERTPSLAKSVLSNELWQELGFEGSGLEFASRLSRKVHPIGGLGESETGPTVIFDWTL
jgi:hypothetical protein